MVRYTQLNVSISLIHLHQEFIIQKEDYLTRYEHSREIN